MTSKRYRVALHTVEVSLPQALSAQDIIPSFSPFVCDEDGDVLLSLTVVEGPAPEHSATEEIGQFDCGGANHGVYLNPDGGYIFEISLPGTDAPLACTLVADRLFTHCVAYLTEGPLSQKSFGLNNALMIAYAFAAAPSDTLLVHASVIRNDGYGYLFTAPSGTGKSTHTHLWYKNIPGSDLMNDDNPVVRIVDGKVRIYGSPWSGKTPCYRNIWAPVGAITRIEQRPENSIRRMKPVEAFATLLPAVSSMKWDRRVYTSICETISKLIGLTPIYWLGCLPDADAAHLSYETIRVKS